MSAPPSNWRSSRGRTKRERLLNSRLSMRNLNASRESSNQWFSNGKTGMRCSGGPATCSMRLAVLAKMPKRTKPSHYMDQATRFNTPLTLVHNGMAMKMIPSRPPAIPQEAKEAIHALTADLDNADNQKTELLSMHELNAVQTPHRLLCVSRAS